MKRFFTFLMAVWALLSISQTVKADDVTVYFQCPDEWRTPVCAYAYNNDADKNPNWDDAPAGSEFYTSTGVKLWKCTFDSKYKKVIFKVITIIIYIRMHRCTPITRTLEIDSNIVCLYRLRYGQ